MREAAARLEKAGVEFVRVGQKILLSSAAINRLRSLPPEKRGPVGELVLFGKTVVFVSHSGQEIVGTLEPTGSNPHQLVATFFVRRK